MNFVNEDIITQNRISITNLLQEIGPEEVREEIIAGLTAEKKHISSKYFYNKAGSELFEEITSLEGVLPHTDRDEYSGKNRSGFNEGL